MIIKSVQVKNFRCILDSTLECEPLTAIVGANGAGKSSFLRALELFYSTNPRFTEDDFFNRDASRDIEITVTFTSLGEEETRQFDAYLEGGELSVTRVLSMRDGKPTAKFYGSSLQNPDFVPVRQAGGATAVRQKYSELRQRREYANLPTATSQGAALQAMQEWELAHPERCVRQRDDGQFFGFTEVGQGYLGRFTRFISIPAVRDASEDATEARGRPITELLDLVARATLANRDEFTQLKVQAQAQYNEFMASGAKAQLDELEERLSATLKAYVPDAGIRLQWITEGGIEISLPKANVQLVEHGYGTSVARAGHGLQRAFILTLLQHLAAAQAIAATSGGQGGGDATSMMPNLVLGVEEPELYQHPSRQRHFADILLKLASGAIPGATGRTQVIYTTHSPLFVGIDRFNQVRLLRKADNVMGMPKATIVMQVTGDDVAEELWRACESGGANQDAQPRFTWETLKPRLQSIMNPWMSEGFFADVVVLVEGEDDRAALLAAALAEGHNFESLGISVIPACGKNNLDRPYVIFKKFGIPTYVVWDNDRRAKEPNPRSNHTLLRLLGSKVTDWPSGVSDTFACFDDKLETVVRAEIGPETFDGLVQDLQSSFGYSKKEDILKNPYLFRKLIEAANGKMATSETLTLIVHAALKLRSTQQVCNA